MHVLSVLTLLPTYRATVLRVWHIVLSLKLVDASELGTGLGYLQKT
jgi:hypothetical protein